MCVFIESKGMIASVEQTATQKEPGMRYCYGILSVCSMFKYSRIRFFMTLSERRKQTQATHYLVKRGM